MGHVISEQFCHSSTSWRWTYRSHFCSDLSVGRSLSVTEVMEIELLLPYIPVRVLHFLSPSLSESVEIHRSIVSTRGERSL